MKEQLEQARKEIKTYLQHLAKVLDQMRSSDGQTAITPQWVNAYGTERYYRGKLTQIDEVLDLLSKQTGA